jgi:hypothetical protein
VIANFYTPGQMAVMTGTFTSPSNGAGVAVSALTLRYKDPTGTETDIPLSSMSNPSLGVYSYALEVLTPGRWKYRFEATGSVIAACENSFIVNSSPFTNPQ